MATNKQLLEAQSIILQSRYSFKPISQQWIEANETWSDYIVRIADEIKRGKYREVRN